MDQIEKMLVRLLVRFIMNGKTIGFRTLVRPIKKKKLYAWIDGWGQIGIGQSNSNNKTKIIEEGISGTLKPGTLSNIEARQWYLKQESRIPGLIDRNLSLEEQAKQAVNLRNQFRTQTRKLMADRELAASLNKTDPNMTWEQVIEKYSRKRISR